MCIDSRGRTIRNRGASREHQLPPRGWLKLCIAGAAPCVRVCHYSIQRRPAAGGSRRVPFTIFLREEGRRIRRKYGVQNCGRREKDPAAAGRRHPRRLSLGCLTRPRRMRLARLPPSRTMRAQRLRLREERQLPARLLGGDERNDRFTPSLLNDLWHRPVVPVQRWQAVRLRTEQPHLGR